MSYVNIFVDTEGLARKKARTVTDIELDKEVYSLGCSKSRMLVSLLSGAIIRTQTVKFHSQLHPE